MRLQIRKIIEEIINKNSIILYRGQESCYNIDNLKYVFLSTDKNFSLEYGDKVFKCEVNLGDVFDSHNISHISDLYNHGFKLNDPYINKQSDEEEYKERGINYNWKNNYYESADDFLNSPYSEDTWEAIESSGVIDFIFQNYDSIKIFEGGIKNYLCKKQDIVSCDPL